VECSRNERYFRRASSFAAYGGTLRELIHLLKYQRVRPAAAVLGRTVAASAVSLASEFESEEVLLVPVPLHRARFRERGFNQAELIASGARSGVAEAFGRKIKLETAALIRRRAT
jgi:predicted amidophosphoribosyltransferase